MFFSGLLEQPFRWIGAEILHIDYNYERNGFGSGDNTYAYITFFVNLVLAFLIVVIWSIADRKRKNYNKFYYWLTVILRLFLIVFMFSYGFVKVFQIQFQPPSLIRMLQPIGEMSPMGLAWTYMGYSKGFGAFAGLMEIVGGILLIPRRTIALGAFIIIGVMAQVAMMNLSFDIPVKLFSIHLILMALVLFLSDKNRFWYAFLKNRKAKFQNSEHPIKNREFHNVVYWTKIIGLIVILGLGCVFGYSAQQKMSPNNTKNLSELYGIWEVDYMVQNSDTISPLLSNTNRWHYLILERKGRAVVKTIGNRLERYYFEVDTTNKKISMYGIEMEKDSLNINFQNQFNSLSLNGILDGDQIDIGLSLKDLNDFPLKSRGFHWVNERPYNR